MIHVLIVDDDAMVADLNCQYVNRVNGFCCCGVATTLAEAGAVLNTSARQVDLILLDVYMQRENGLSLLPVIRASGRNTDV
ncbi:MAG TPA: two-component system response regulator DcuR, partial [Leclercia adecarboxylata]|nr:two-component system response regulator DcuR [Leclercia adecarboxylata]